MEGLASRCGGFVDLKCFGGLKTVKIVSGALNRSIWVES